MRFYSLRADAAGTTIRHLARPLGAAAMSSKSSPAKPKISSPERKEAASTQPEELSPEERAEIALRITAQEKRGRPPSI
jgi:hypothetical protein